MTAEELVAFEREIAEAFNAGKIRAPIHLDGGNEHQLIEVFQKIKSDHWVACSWRSHYKALLKGVPPEKVRAEIMAGRSIAMSFPEYRFLSSAIVAGQLPIALGIALGIKRRDGAEQVHVFCGDMTARTGAFHECVTYATGHDLPIRFIVEDNGISVCTVTQDVWGRRKSWPNIVRIPYKLPWPHSGAGVRVNF